MKKIFLLCLLLSGCGPCMPPHECRQICEPRKVDKLTWGGCYCEVEKKP